MDLCQLSIHILCCSDIIDMFKSVMVAEQLELRYVYLCWGHDDLLGLSEEAQKEQDWDWDKAQHKAFRLGETFISTSENVHRIFSSLFFIYLFLISNFRHLKPGFQDFPHRTRIIVFLFPLNFPLNFVHFLNYPLSLQILHSSLSDLRHQVSPVRAERQRGRAQEAMDFQDAIPHSA